MDLAQQQLIALLFRLLWLAGGVLSGAMLVIARQWRQKKYLREALERQERVGSSRTQAAVQTAVDRLLKRFLQEPRPSLRRLADDSETDFTIKR